MQAVRERSHVVEYLQRHIPRLEVCWDKKRNHMATYLDCLRMAGDDPCVHLEDDIILTQAFQDKAEQEINAKPEHVIQFFSRRADDITKGSRFDRRFLANLCWYCPPGLGTQLLAYAPTWLSRNKDQPDASDYMMDDFLRSRKLAHWIHVPSLVQHREMKSTLGPRSSKRQSPTFQDPIPDAEDA